LKKDGDLEVLLKLGFEVRTGKILLVLLGIYLDSILTEVWW
jgi:hypothetical protein